MDGMVDRLAETRPAVSLALLAIFLVWETAAPLLHQYNQNRRARVQHALRNLFLGAINALVIAVVFIGAWTAAMDASAHSRFGLLWRFDLPPALEAAIVLVILDAWTYVWHRLNHSLPFFWRFHRVHHSDAAMDVTTATRFHLGEIVLSSLLRIPLLYLSGAELWQLALYEVLLFSVVQFHHANIQLPHAIDRVLRVFIVTPAMHRVHHSRLPEHQQSNYTSLFSVWDRAFGTFTIVAEIAALPTGVEGADDDHLLAVLSAPALPARAAADQPV